jgi:glycosyltransferase involved in cell wall biosynthesis
MRPLISVVMTTFNMSAFIQQAVQSVFDQDYRPLELIVVDDCSMDDTVDRVKQFYKLGSLTVITHTSNVGISKSLNEAINRSSGTYIARMDADDISEPDRISSQVSLLDSNRQIGMVGTGAIIVDEELRPLLRLRHPSESQAIKTKLRDTFPFVSGSLMFRREVFLAVGLFDEHVPGCEDLELALRICDAYEAANIAQDLYYWRKTIKGESNITAAAQKQRADLARQVYLAKKTNDITKLDQIYPAFKKHYRITTHGPKRSNSSILETNYYQSLIRGCLKYGINKSTTNIYFEKLKLTSISPREMLFYRLYSFLPGKLRRIIVSLYELITGIHKGLSPINN